MSTIMIFVLTHDAVRRPKLLKTRHIPRKVIGRGIPLWPKTGLRHRLAWRLMLEWALARYFAALLPFPMAILIWPSLALPISAAPLLMFAAIYAVEMRVLAVPNAKAREALIDQAAADRVMDVVRLGSVDALTRIAAGRGLEEGLLHLVIEQSALARVPPLTIISVQQTLDGTRFVDLDHAEQHMIQDVLFSHGLDEGDLQRTNLRENVFLRAVELDPRSISAHARLQAMARNTPSLTQNGPEEPARPVSA
ncbi:hypothetical protein [Actibacterium sp. 188UL27-1]|uniref:hypothetical protein n=1 Tax=Actibacterium sp. 188UL27-1 TaxID=2786961 RepID=UPI0019599A4D|nr:hypothetical protein [Actibacterium sp. 188UL27-1]MBM7067990.1 hypothetical protein [Actibacterium sp. 188UL27-1]